MREQFLKLLAEHPGDINIGLIYADWLAEEGDPEEAYWRDPRIYAQAYTAIFDNYGLGFGFGYGVPVDILLQNGDGYGFGETATEHGDGCGDGCDFSGYIYGHMSGDGSGHCMEDVPSGPKERTQDFLGTCLRFEVLMEGRFVLVCDRGFVLIGDVSPHSSDWQRVIVDHCATIRQWCTTRGLGQLALEGPQPETILDYEGSGVDVLRATILRAIPCNETALEQYPEVITNKDD